MIKLKFILVLSLALLGRAMASDSASNNHGEDKGHGKTEHSAEFKGITIDVRDTPSDFKLPGKLWNTLVSDGGGATADGHDKKQEHGTASKEEKIDTLIVWLPVEVSFSAKQSGILAHESVQYNLPRGGGTLDTAKITDGDKGTFYLKFNLNEFSNPSAMKVYFVSNAKKRRVDGEIFGAGCNVYFDVTKVFQKLNSGEGLKFNITDNRHISAMSGHFIFVQTEKDKVYLSQVEFTDSKNRDYLCKI
ncbi:MAG: hypothetical protein JNM24_09730 [Bdellovibrionaceae bacterium]|nr:hypothetical protein [Pseudobdellovibrionaceae bacterium]